MVRTVFWSLDIAILVEHDERFLDPCSDTSKLMASWWDTPRVILPRRIFRYGLDLAWQKPASTRLKNLTNQGADDTYIEAFFPGQHVDHGFPLNLTS
jgi:hypothetical protein